MSASLSKIFFTPLVQGFINSITYSRVNSPAERAASPSQRPASPKAGYDSVAPPAGAQGKLRNALSHGLTPVATGLSPPCGG